MRFRRSTLIVTLLSLALWWGWVLLRPERHPNNDLSRGHYTDHFSHMNVARVFPRVGDEVWRKPMAQLFRSLTSQELSGLPADVKSIAGPEVRYVPGWPEDKPMASSWSKKPRMYPPGDMLLVLPIALAYHFTSLSFAGANQLLILLYLL